MFAGLKPVKRGPRFRGVEMYQARLDGGATLTCHRGRWRSHMDDDGNVTMREHDPRRTLHFVTGPGCRIVLLRRNDVDDDLAVVRVVGMVDDCKTVLVRPRIGSISDGEVWALPVKERA